MRGPGGPALGSPVRTEVPQGPPGSELRSRSWSCDGDLARLAQPWGRQPGRSGSGGGQLRPGDGRLRNEESPGKRVGRHDCLLSTYCIRWHLTAGVQYRPVKPHAGDHRLSTLYLKTQPQGQRPPGPRPLHEQVAGPGLFVCLTVSPEPPLGHTASWPRLSRDPFLWIKRPPTPHNYSP